ncbi:lipopolysaccharide transport periplasmic protein LptA [Oleiagrimonas soli]|uniref:Lipopolysaccharide export system protein LptA n=1 Tax=Oleiagrimonas soli TaxID=1543381 RepID=A0A841KIZ7_9GAMM|nr:lipopolysaccharide transport periplasmic protein LptA [Oleiagrimonas soli]MBB6185583.1 lipopolysaccharide export system protein LptA [Oleiagrimonas soli]
MAPSSPAPKSAADPRRVLRLAAFGLLGLLLCGAATAKQSDRSPPVNVDARSADASAQPNGISHIKGNVVITQGTLKATSDLATIYFDAQSQVKRVVLTGHAHIQQLDDNGNLMTGNADSIDYDVPEGVAILTGNAHVKQVNRGSASGDRLVYDTKSSTMTAQSTSDEGRVHLVFKAKQQPAKSAPASNASAPAATTTAPSPAASTPAPAPAASAATGN